MAQKEIELPRPFTSLRLPTFQQFREIRWWQVLFGLALLGQFLAPLFLVIHIWPFKPIAEFIYWLGSTICPIAWDTPSVFGHPMIVCPLCYGALIAVTTLTFSYPRPEGPWRWWQAIAPLARLGIITLSLVPWLASYVMIKAGAWNLSWGAMLVFGMIGGVGTALLGFQMMELADDPAKRGAR